jgi:hypothetical protein
MSFQVSTASVQEMIGIRFCPVSAARARGIVAGRAKDLRFFHCCGTVKLSCHLGIRYQSPKHIKDRLYGAVLALVHLGRDRTLNHLPKKVALLVDAHQRPAVDLALDFTDAGLYVQPMIQLVAQGRRISDMRAEF